MLATQQIFTGSASLPLVSSSIATTVNATANCTTRSMRWCQVRATHRAGGYDATRRWEDDDKEGLQDVASLDWSPVQFPCFTHYCLAYLMGMGSRCVHCGDHCVSCLISRHGGERDERNSRAPIEHRYEHIMSCLCQIERMLPALAIFRTLTSSSFSTH